MIWAAISAIAAVCMLLGALGTVIFNLGRHSTRLSQAEKDIEDLRSKSDGHASQLGLLNGMNDLLQEVRHDVKNLLTGRVVPGRRPE